MAKIRAETFQRGLRFRTQMPAECMASECSLMCDDMHRLGLRRAVVDPNVVTTYHYHHKAHLLNHPGLWSNITGIKPTTWAEVATASPIDWHNTTWAVAYDKVVCCDLLPGKDLIDWEKGCRKQDIMRVNYTQQWLASGPSWTIAGFTHGGR